MLWYQLSVRLGLNPVKRLSASMPSGPFYRMPIETGSGLLKGSKQWKEKHCYFGWKDILSTEIPAWHINPFNGNSVETPDFCWWLIPDFDPVLGDVKTVWEASRFDWVLGFSQAASRGDVEYLDRLNLWITDWGKCNPPYHGVNWKCGQEASIRVMHLAIAALILNQVYVPEKALVELIKVHLKRIRPTISYAMAQNNNHGTSEAAALFIGGSWLVLVGDAEGEEWQRLGRKWLENRAQKLIEEDGSFSQYSLTYHRLMLDTFSVVEVWRKTLALPAFKDSFYSRMTLASNWLYQFVQPETGDAPNLGHNDGARLLPLDDTDYRDFRPSVQLSMALFQDRCAYEGEGDWNQLLHWLDLTVPTQAAIQLGSWQFDHGGYCLLRRAGAMVLLNYPRFHFRPSQADALQLDLWVDGVNLLRDAGTYSYNKGDEVVSYFGGTEGHNTVQFDGRDQMPRLSRFLLGDWLEAENIEPVRENGNELRCAAGYTDCEGASHHRSVELMQETLRVEDKVFGFNETAVLRWRLKPGDWHLQGATLTNGDHKLIITADMPIDDISLIDGWESRYYLLKSKVPVLVVKVTHSGCIYTEYRFSS